MGPYQVLPVTRGYLHIRVWGDAGLLGRLISLACWGMSGLYTTGAGNQASEWGKGVEEDPGGSCPWARGLGQGLEAQAGAGKMPWVSHCLHAWDGRNLAADSLCLGVRLWGGYRPVSVACDGRTYGKLLKCQIILLGWGYCLSPDLRPTFWEGNQKEKQAN